MTNQTLPVPLDLIREILLRLPVRSVLRFKCVCKSWRSLISDSQFGISHYDLAAAPSHRILLRSNDFYIESIDIDAPQLIENSAAVLFLLPPTSPPYHCEFDYYADHNDKHEILGSCRGLVVLYYNRTDDLVLWNPSIGAYIRLPDFEFGLTSQFFLYGFGYDASKDDYLLIVIELFGSGYADADFHVCSFITEPWRWERSRLYFPYKNLDDSFKAGSLLNGALHWLVLCKDKKVPVIIAFDMIEESLSEIPLLDHLTMEKCQVYSLRVMGGCLSVCCSSRGCEMDELWVMKEYKVQSSWTKSTVIPTYGFSPICITKDGAIFGSNLLGILVKLNDKGELFQHLAYGRTQKLYQANLQCAMYRESLLSLPSVTTHCGKQVKMTSSNKLGKIGL